MGKLDRVALLLEGRVRARDEGLDVFAHDIIGLDRLGLLQPLEEGIHRGHHEGVAREGPDDVVDARGLLRVAALHEVLRAAHHADGQTAAKGLAIDDEVGLDVVSSLRTLGVQAEAGINLVEDQRNVAPRADRPQLVQPLLVTGRGADLPIVRGQDRVARRGLVEVEALQRVDQDCRDLALAQLNDLEGQLAHVLQAEDIRRDPVVADNRLHAIPPSVVRPAECHAHLPVRVEARDAHRAHHGLGAGHVEGHLGVAGDLSEHRDVVQHRFVQGAQEEARLLGRFPALLNELLVRLVAADVDAVRAADVHGFVAIQVHNIDTLGAVQGHGGIEVLLHDLVESREAAARGEAQVGDHFLQLLGKVRALRVLRLPLVAQLLEGDSPLLGDLCGAAITVVEVFLGDGVLRQDVLGNRQDHGQWVRRRHRQGPFVQHGDRPHEEQGRDGGDRVIAAQAHRRHDRPQQKACGRPTVASGRELTEGHQKQQEGNGLDEKHRVGLHAKHRAMQNRPRLLNPGRGVETMRGLGA
mmetsp:Transcript_78182/g.252787  ORF Transcript_78182/g.252787 Transcript_78182/m.252787 type:complete len:525 (+) Transcript_78182:507-2081(+)